MTFIAGELAARLRLEGKAQVDADLTSTGRVFTNVQQIAQKAGAGIAAGFKVGAAAASALTVAAVATGVAFFGTAARVAELDIAMTAVGKSTGVGYKAISDTANAVKAQGIEMASAQTLALQFAQAQLDLSVASKVARVAQDLAVVSGKNSTEVTDLLVHAIMTQQTELLRSAGITKSAQEAYDVYAASVGKSAADLTELEKKQALVNLVLTEGAKVAGTYEAAMTSPGKVLRSFPRLLNDISVALGTPLLGAFGPAIVEGYNFTKSFDAAVSSGGRLEPLVKLLGDRVQKYTVPLRNAVATGVEWMNGLRTSAPLLDAVNRGLDKLESYTPGIAAGGAALLAWGGTSIPILGRFLPAVNPVLAAILALIATSPELRAAGVDFVSSLSPLIPVATSLAAVIARGLNSALPVAADGIRLVTDVVKPAIDLLASVPAPVLAGAAAFLLLNSRLRPFSDGIKNGATSLIQLGAQINASRLVALEFGATNATIALGAMKGAARGVGIALKEAFISNPIGLALTVISGAVAIWMTANANAAAAVEVHDERVKELQQTLNEATGATTAATRASMAQKLVDDGHVDTLKKLGINSDRYVDALLGQADANAEVRRQLVAQTIEQAKQGPLFADAAKAAGQLGLSYDTLALAALGNADAVQQVRDAVINYDGAAGPMKATQASLIAAFETTSGSAKVLTGYLDEQQHIVDDARQAQADYRAALAKSADAMTDTERSSKRLNDAIAIARDTSADATKRLEALKDALDELKGGSKTAQEAQFELAGQTLDLAEALTQLNDAGAKVPATFVDASGTIDSTSRAGQTLFGTVNDINDGMLTAMQAAHDWAIANGDVAGAQKAATDAAAPFIQSLHDTAIAAGLTEEQAQGLIDKYLAVPSVVATVIDDNADEVSIRLANLATQINATPDHTVVLDEPFSKDIMKKLEDLGFTVKNLPNGKVQVSASGVPDVEAALNNLVRTRTATIRVSGAGMQMQANGGIWQGGKQHFANGGFPSGIYQGRPGGIPMGDNRVFAEKETRREAFISDKPGQESRNRSILQTVAGWFGLETVPIGQNRPTATQPVTSSSSNGSAPASLESAYAQLIAALENLKIVNLGGINFVNPVHKEPIDDALTANAITTAVLGV